MERTRAEVRAVLDYACRLAAVRDEHESDLLTVMRVYFEKPRTVTGWKGLINDPEMDGGHDVHRGLRTARMLLLDIVSLGLPMGCEWLDPITPQAGALSVSPHAEYDGRPAPVVNWRCPITGSGHAPPRRDGARLRWSAWRRRYQHRARQVHQRWNAYAEITP